MPLHDWTRVGAGVWHAFHLGWIAEIQLALNGGLLPSNYYAQIECSEPVSLRSFGEQQVLKEGSMPIHDWTGVGAGVWHDFHVAWITELRNELNGGLLPPDYYAQAEQIVGPMGPDVLTLQEQDPSANGSNSHAGGGGVALALARPRVRFVAEAEMEDYEHKRRTLVIRHSSGDRVVALLEIVSPGNKSGQRAIQSFVGKALEALHREYHLLIVDLFPPGPRDPNGLHALIWDEISGGSFVQPPDEPLSLMAYSAGFPKVSYVEPTAIGRELIEMPLFLDPEYYVNVPLETTYQRAYRGVPRRWQSVLDPPLV